MKKRSPRHLASAAMLFAASTTIYSQTPSHDASVSTSAATLPEAPQPHGFHCDRSAQPGQIVDPNRADPPVTLLGVPCAILKDEYHVVTSPARLRARDLKWLLPLGAATGVSIATDQRANRDVVSHDASFNNSNVNASNVLVGGLIAAPVALFGVGYLKHDEHAREAGLLGGEAMVDSIIVGEVSKLIFFRERPLLDNARGRFFTGKAGTNSSFVSSHSIVAWSSAAVLAGEYSSPWKQAGIYTLATGVSLTRVLGQQHFPSDVLVGAASGWLIGHYVYRSHHKHAVR